MATTTRAALGALLATGLLAAQTQNIVYHDDPSPATGFANAFPFGSEGVRIQQLIPQSVLGNTPTLLQDLFVNPGQTTRIPWSVSEVVYDDFEIRMGHSTVGTLTTTWATNNPNATTVYRGPLRVRFEADVWVPIGLPKPYLWNPTAANEDLVIDFILWKVQSTGSITPDINGYFMWSKSSPTRTIQRAFLRGWTNAQPATAQNVDGNGIKLGLLLNDGNFVAHGGGCTGSSGKAPSIASPAGTWPQIGAALTVQLTDGPASSSAFLTIGTNNIALGPLPLPFDLALFGAAKCFVWHDPLATTAPAATDGSGNASVALPVPNDPGLIGVRLFGSWICVDPGANALGFTTSGFATLILGT